MTKMYTIHKTENDVGNKKQKKKLDADEKECSKHEHA